MKLPPPRVRWYIILACCAVLHAAFIQLTIGDTIPIHLPDWWYSGETWVAIASLWLLWPVALLLHRGRVWLGFAVTVCISIFFLLPCIGFYRLVAPEAFGFSRAPTADHPVIESSADLGGGFRRVGLAEFITGGFESIYHGEYLYYRDRKLGDFVSSSVSPSRQFAAFVESDVESPIRDDHFGFRVFLFRVTDQKIIPLTQDLRYDWDGFEWDEAAGNLILRHRHDVPDNFSLPKT